MKKVLLTTALIAALGTSATAQGIQPVATAPATDVTVGTLAGENTQLIAAIAGLVGVALLLSHSSSDGTQ